MKKTIATVATAALLGFGLVGLADTASASGNNYGYSGCAPTTTSGNTPSRTRHGKNTKLTVRVDGAGNAAPTGKVIFTIKRKGGGYFLKKSAYYNGGKLTTYTGKLFKEGKYKVKYKFEPDPNGMFCDDKDFDGFDVD